MDSCAAKVQPFFQPGFYYCVLLDTLTVAKIIQRRWNEWMSTEYWWNVGDRRNPSNVGQNLTHCHSFHHKSHPNWPGSETGSPQWDTADICLTVSWTLEYWNIHSLCNSSECRNFPCGQRKYNKVYIFLHHLIRSAGDDRNLISFRARSVCGCTSLLHQNAGSGRLATN